MKNWDKIKGGIGLMLNIDTPEELAEWFSSHDLCQECRVFDYCSAKMYLYDENGQPIRDKDGDCIYDDECGGCEKIVLDWLNEEAES